MFEIKEAFNDCGPIHQASPEDRLRVLLSEFPSQYRHKLDQPHSMRWAKEFTVLAIR
jgi:hypothetical protein